MSTPDLTGFREAMGRKRAAFGEPVTFHVPGQQAWPAGTKLDPQTGRPYDPLIQPTSTDGGDVELTVEVASSPGRKDGDEPTAIGNFEVGDIMLILDLDDEAAVEGATSFSLRGESYAIRASRRDGLVGADRFVIFGEREA